MSFTGSPASARALRVPPVAISSTPYLCDSSRAKSTRPVLSETLSKARRMGRSIGKVPLWKALFYCAARHLNHSARCDAS